MSGVCLVSHAGCYILGEIVHSVAEPHLGVRVVVWVKQHALCSTAMLGT